MKKRIGILGCWIIGAFLLTACSRNNYEKASLTTENSVKESETTTEETEDIKKVHYKYKGAEFDIPEEWLSIGVQNNFDVFELNDGSRLTIKYEKIPEIMKVDGSESSIQTKEDVVEFYSFPDTLKIDTKTWEEINNIEYADIHYVMQDQKYIRSCIVPINENDAAFNVQIACYNRDDLDAADIVLESLVLPAGFPEDDSETEEETVNDVSTEENTNAIFSKTKYEVVDYVKDNLKKINESYLVSDNISDNNTVYTCPVMYGEEGVAMIGFAKEKFQQDIPKQYNIFLSNFTNLHDNLEVLAITYLIMAADPQLSENEVFDMLEEMIDNLSNEEEVNIQKNGWTIRAGYSGTILGVTITADN